MESELIHSPLFMHISGDSAMKKKKKKKKKEEGRTCGGFEACWRLLTGERLGRWLAFLLLQYVFFLLCSSLFLFLMVLLLMGRTVAADGDDDGGVTMALFYSGGQCFAAIFPVCIEVWVFSFSSLVLQQGRKMVRG
jgi:hypothetical protein